ncbi:ASCH domain-containing protein [Paraburkholderia nemoris]|uniref:ASCH domain-containing protein n=1 Tax=Paraburkholderia nemoris TaxID=2793076 RepID=UPI0038B7F9F9
MADLHLNLKGEYFDQIKAGAKSHEYRLAATWLKRLSRKSFDRILVKRGYPRSGDAVRIIERPWRGFELQTITHPHFGSEPVDVCAIRVN